MNFDPDNPVVKLCARGMQLESEFKTAAAQASFNEAWAIARNDVEKFAAAHYIARHQQCVEDKLKWDQVALEHALAVNDPSIYSVLPSLYLNIGKCYEDTEHLTLAMEHYQSAKSYLHHLPDDGYGNMIRNGVQAGIKRVTR